MDRSVKVKITKVRRSTITAPGSVIRAPCPFCEHEVEVIAMAQAIEILKVSDPVFDELVAYGIVHSVRTISGNVWVCKDSLFENKLASVRSG